MIFKDIIAIAPHRPDVRAGAVVDVVAAIRDAA